MCLTCELGLKVRCEVVGGRNGYFYIFFYSSETFLDISKTVFLCKHYNSFKIKSNVTPN